MTNENVDEIVASDRTQASDQDAAFGMNEREAAIAPFHRHGTGVEFEVFDAPNDVVVRYRPRAIVTDRHATVLVLAPSGPDSKCRGLILKSIKDNSPQLNSTVAMTQHRSSHSSAGYRRSSFH